MKPSFDVIVCGSLHLDIIVEAPHLPRLDETVTATSWKKVCGGKGGNQAVMAARSGAKCAMIGCIGEDDFGQTLCSNLQANKVNIEQISVDPKIGSGISVAIIDRSGEYGAVIVSGSNLKLLPEKASDSWHDLGGASILILQNEIPELVNIGVARAAKVRGSRLILNAAPVREMSQELLSLVDVLVVNRIEAEMLCGAPVTDVISATAAMPKLTNPSRDVVITLGGAGVVYSERGREPQFISPVKVIVKSTHGAGDCFVGALAFGLARSMGLGAACQHANQIAAKFVAGKSIN